MRLGGVSLALVAGASLAAAGAQDASRRVTGIVTTDEGERVVGADVRPLGSSTGATTDETGAFSFTVAAGSLAHVLVRRIGFRPETVAVAPAAGPLTVHLTRTIQLIAPVVVTEEANALSTIGKVRARARTSPNGTFLFRDHFMQALPSRFTDIVRRVPGVRIMRTPLNPEAVVLRTNNCEPLYFIDGMSVMGPSFDPNSQPVDAIEAIEVYASPALVPPEFRGPMSAQGCGSILIWTRRGEPRPRRTTIGADSIMRLLDARRVFDATEVDRPAEPTSIPTPAYPDSLLAAGTGGTVVLEFIVTARGRVDPASIGIVLATHAQFAERAKAVAADAVFTPAERAGHAVAQVYQLPVVFTPPASRP